jgi:hypothetical protein
MITEKYMILKTCLRSVYEPKSLARLILFPEDGDDAFLLNFGSYADYTALCPRRWQFS